MWSQLTIASLIREGKKTGILAVPLIIGQVSQMLIMIADTYMVGKVGVTELAAMSFASAIFSVPFVFGIGLLISVSILTSGAVGRDDEGEARSVCRNGFYLALGGGFVLFLLSAICIPFLSIFGQPEDVTAIAPPYLSLILISLVPALGSIALKNHTDALDRPWPAFWIFLGGVLLNIVLNQLLIFTLGYGLVGAGWATLISRTAILGAMLLWLKRSPDIRSLAPNHWIKKPNGKMFRRLFALGIPASFHLLAEVGAFSAAGFLVGLYGKVPLAAHQLALTTAGTLFMIPLGIALAITIRVGSVAGAGEEERLPAVIVSAWIVTLAFIILTGLVCGLGRETIAGWYRTTPEVTMLAAQFLLIVAIFQFGDALQVVSAGILRGLEDVKTSAWAAFFSYWIFGLPAGIVLGKFAGLGAHGIWWGLAIGLFIAAVFLSMRVVRLVGRG